MAAGQTSVMKAVQMQLNERYPTIELRRKSPSMELVIYCRDCDSTQGLTTSLFDGPYAILDKAQDLCANFHSQCTVARAQGYNREVTLRDIVSERLRKKKESNVIAGTERQKRAIALD